MMIVEDADRFGLAQLHQLRGRVGRGTAESFCVLVSDRDRRDRPARGCKAVAELSDGFELAERDFELRREGDVLGFAQSGLPGLRVASLTRPDHQALAVRARTTPRPSSATAGRWIGGATPSWRPLDRGARARLAAPPRDGRPGDRLVTARR